MTPQIGRSSNQKSEKSDLKESYNEKMKNLHPRKLSTGGPQNDGPWKAGNGTLWKWQLLLVSMLTYPKPNFLTVGHYIKYGSPKKFNVWFPGSLERWVCWISWKISSVESFSKHNIPKAKKKRLVVHLKNGSLLEYIHRQSFVGFLRGGRVQGEG